MPCSFDVLHPGAEQIWVDGRAGSIGLNNMFFALVIVLPGRDNVVDVFDYFAIALSSALCLFGLYLRRRRFRHVREMAEADFAAH
ncbi:hypothetical protein T459_01829 [Capsicum annuum]|uniref:Uncharacterized protein n=1 Tax=Capsicum annuum TaxID=4072 RepID=A0A2G3AI80_CAPAN|nr:hypothetical protein T459_01829 [Capsicum annuum]